MIAPLFLILAAQDVPAATAVAEDEVTVIARKLKDWRGLMKVRKGSAGCKTVRSTGDREIDAIGCAAMQTCFPRYMPRFEALLNDKTLDAEARKQANAPINAELTTCVKAEHDTGIAVLADRRAAAR